MEVNDRIERMKHVMDVKGLKNVDLGYHTGMHPNTINNYLKGKTSPNWEFFEGFKKTVPDLDLNWLITGTGKPFLEGFAKEDGHVVERTSYVKEPAKASTMQMILDIEQQFSEKIEQLKADVLGKLKGVTNGQFARRQIVDTRVLHAM